MDLTEEGYNGTYPSVTKEKEEQEISAITKEQLLKWAAAWQVMITLVFWYMNEFGVDSLNRLLFGIALVVAFLITFLKKDNTEKVVTAVGTIEKFVAAQTTGPARTITMETIAADLKWLEDQKDG